MVARSQNGYEANNRALLAEFWIGDRKFLFRRGSPGKLLHRALTWFDANIRDINPGIMDDWSYAERPIRGGEELSNHASGTAGDVDATKWPLGVDPSTYLTPDETRRWRGHLEEYEGCLRWGGDYVGRKDPMHVEVDEDEATCDRVWAKLNKAAPAAPDEPTTEAEVLAQVSLSNPTGDTPDQPFLLTVDAVGNSLVLPKGAQAFLQWAAFFPPPPGQGAASTEKARLDWLVYRKETGDQPVTGRDLKHRDRSAVTPLPVGTREVEGRVLGIPKGGVFTVQVSAVGRAR